MLTVFNNLSLDGYFVDGAGSMAWAHEGADDEWNRFAADNAQGGRGPLVFGRVTYELMAGFWQSPAARAQMPEVAEGMNRLPKLVFSRTLDEATWPNTELVRGDPAEELARRKAIAGEPMLILGSGTLVAQLTRARLIDAYTFVIVPVVLGAGRTLFDGLDAPVRLRRRDERAFGNGNVVATYVPA